jgi:hypothetical protein
MLQMGNLVARQRLAPGALQGMIRDIYRMTPHQFRTAMEAAVFGERHVELLD